MIQQRSSSYSLHTDAMPSITACSCRRNPLQAAPSSSQPAAPPHLQLRNRGNKPSRLFLPCRPRRRPRRPAAAAGRRHCPRLFERSLFVCQLVAQQVSGCQRLLALLQRCNRLRNEHLRHACGGVSAGSQLWDWLHAGGRLQRLQPQLANTVPVYFSPAADSRANRAETRGRQPCAAQRCATRCARAAPSCPLPAGLPHAASQTGRCGVK